MKRISLIVPCLNEEEAIPAFKQEIDRVFKECLEGYAPELIFVDDGSTDRSLEMIKKMAEHSPEVKFISFSRNFGKEAAIYAGLEAATGDYAAVMDVDLQDPPSLLPDMLKAIEKDMTVRGRAASPGRGNRCCGPFSPAPFIRRFIRYRTPASWTEPGTTS